MNKDKLTNDTTSGKTQLNPISGSDGFDGSHNLPAKGDSCSENTPSSPTGSDNSSGKGDTLSSPTGSDNPPHKGKANSDSAPTGSDNPPHKGDSSLPSTPGSDNSPPKGKADSGSAPRGSDDSSPKGDSSPPSSRPRPPITIGKPSKYENSDATSSDGGSDNPGGKG